MKPRLRYRPGVGIFRPYSWYVHEATGRVARSMFLGPYPSIEDALEASKAAPSGTWTIGPTSGARISERLMNALCGYEPISYEIAEAAP